ncbi:MAG: 30S ribosomal protein S27ae [Candidatus Caldarchaeum sp.]|nr:30S ribosomal protein S27ae [Candidatus Caldarchaeum sp.]MDW8359405.1 30S ribosomal protein S27ae [Candidatus Caldarchaeum sp.]
MTKKSLWSRFELKDNVLRRALSSCPRCGPGFFMADHGNRLTCGKCGYTKFKS